MALVISCPSCRQSLSLKDEWAGKRVKCPTCSETLTVPVRAVPVAVASVIKPPAATATPAPVAEENPDVKTALKKPGKKKKKAKQSEEKNDKLMLWLVIGGSVLMVGLIATLLFVFVPWGKLLANKDVAVVDVYTAVNGMRAPKLGEAHDLSTFAIPGRMKILVTRPNPQGEYLLVHAKLSYQDLEDYFKFAKGRYFVDGRMIHLEADGQQYNAMIVQTEENHTKGYFEFDYSPKGDNPPPLSAFLGPKAGDWTHAGEKEETAEGLVFKGASGMKVTIGSGEGGPGHKGGGLRVTWNEGCDGWVVDDSIEQPNELGLNWELILLFQKPKTQSKEVKLVMLNKARNLKLP